MNGTFFLIFSVYLDLDNYYRVDPTYFTIDLQDGLQRYPVPSNLISERFDSEDELIIYLNNFIPQLPDERIFVVSTGEFLELHDAYGDKQ